MSAAYGAIALISLLLIGVCVAVDKKRDINLLLLFVSVFVCNAGYFLISVSKTLTNALVSNAISYLGSVFLPLFMLMMILSLCNIRTGKTAGGILIGLGVVMFLLTASPGISDVYYSAVSIEKVNGATNLVREYGPLHCMYSVYLFAYFAAMMSMVIYAIIKKKITSLLHTAFLLAAVFGNIAIWFIERFIPRNFEFLSVSYVLTELFILLLYGIVQEYDNRRMAEEKAVYTTEQPICEPNSEICEKEGTELFDKAEIDNIVTCSEISEILTNREKDVLRLLLENVRRKDIAESLFVTESTIKKYTAQIYRKLSVSSRIELFARLKNLK